MASRRPQRSKNAAARGPSLPPPAAWNTSACVSVTAACGAATALLPGGCAGLHLCFLHHEWPAKRRLEHHPDGIVSAFEQRIARIDVDRADDRLGRSNPSRLPGRPDEPIEQLAHAAQSCRPGASLEPGEVVGLEGHGDRLFSHCVHTISSDDMWVKRVSYRT